MDGACGKWKVCECYDIRMLESISKNVLDYKKSDYKKPWE